MEFFVEIAILIIIATILAYLAKMFKQQIVPAYILTGFIIGPIVVHFLGFNSISNLAILQDMSEIGITFLLFIVGLEIDLRKLKDVGMVATLGTTMQFILLFIGGFLVSSFFFSTTHSVFLGFTLAFGSTMVVIDTLTRKGEIDTLHGRISLGILLMQDVIAIFAITLLSGLSVSNGGFETFLGITIAIVKAIILLIITYAAMKIFPFIFRFAARYQELLFMCSIAVAFSFALIAEHLGDIMVWLIEPFNLITPTLITLIEPGFSTAIGGFLGGVALGSLPYSFEISGKISSLKEFFATIFFVSLGMKLEILGMGNILVPTICLLLFLVIAKPFIISIVTAFFGFEKKTSFITGISLFQVSEFAIIIDTLALSYGIISQEIFSLTVLLAAITMVLTSYFIPHKSFLYNVIGSKIKYLHMIARKNESLQFLPDDVSKEVVLIGFNRIGFGIFRTIKRLKHNFLVLDYNPETIKRLIKNGIHCIYGDAGDSETLEKLRLREAKIVISTAPDFKTNLIITEKTKGNNSDVVLFVTAYNSDDALELYDAGADYVILPHVLGGDHVSFMLEDISEDLSRIVKHRFNHIYELNERMTHNLE